MIIVLARVLSIHLFLMDKTSLQKSSDGMILVVSYLVLFVVNSIVIYLAHMLFPSLVVLGTRSLSLVWAIALSMGVLSLINTFAIPLIRVYENERKRMFSTNEWMIAYFLLNFGGIWLIARGSAQLGLGITSWLVALVLTVAFDLVQGLVMMKLEKMRV